MSGNTIRASVVLSRWIPLVLLTAVLGFGCGGGGGGGGGGDSPVINARLESNGASPGGTAQAALIISDPSGIAGMDVELTFDPTALSVSSVSTSGPASDFIMSYNEQPAGVLSVSMARARGIAAGMKDQALLDMEFSVNQIVQSGSAIPVLIALDAYDDQPSPMLIQSGSAAIMVQ